jgi:hypothetical protein
LPEQDRDVLIDRSVFHCRGDEAPAGRELLSKGLSGFGFEGYFP